jgi:hypothetical protein
VHLQLAGSAAHHVTHRVRATLAEQGKALFS